MGSMIVNFLFFLISSFYMELVYHFTSFGWSRFNPFIGLFLWTFLAAAASMLTGFLKKKVNRIIFWTLLALMYVLYAAQLVYMRIFSQPLLIAAIKNGAKNAVTNYWREALYQMLQVALPLLLLAVPFFAAGFLIHRQMLPLKSHKRKERIACLGAMALSLLLFIAVLAGGRFAKTVYYEEYSSFYDPLGVMSEYGVSSAVVRDILTDSFPGSNEGLPVWENLTADLPADSSVDLPAITDAPDNTGDTAEEPDAQEGTQEEPLDTSPHVLPIDFDSLIADADSDKIAELAAFMQSMPATNKNEYTGMFAGYNLIYLTAEGFSPYAVDEELTPTLYRLTHSGFVFQDYYVPLWQTSTSDGEYVNCTGLIPEGQFSMRKSADNAMPFSLPAYFALEGVKSYAFHNNSLSYYDRNLSHPNLGYNFMASKLGDLPEAEWAGQIFEMENANYWPSSDLDMMKATIPYYIEEDRFHVYYMTVSGHMNYNFSGNRMSSLHKEEVADLPYSEEGRAYIACNIELDRALEYLIAELEKAGKLENTVICLSADHYPYAMDIANLEELAGKPLEGTLEIYRNNLILWNSAMETVEVEKTACALDILPTLLNLFGFEYDSRLYVGRDILSDSTPLVIFSDQSFITEKVMYNKKAKEITYRDGYEEDEEYYQAVKKQVKGLYSYAGEILKQDFYRYVEAALPQEYRSQIDPAWTAPHAVGELTPATTPIPAEEAGEESGD